jgi:membrane-associated PAP2 superfamily phosphatase
VLSMGICTAIVTPLKDVTAIQCPWDLQEFGGRELYAPLFGHHEPTAHPGRCWPGGHASSGFVFFALFFLLRDRKPKLARIAFAAAFILGSILSLGRMMQGAHFLSHNVWTALFDWTIALGCYYLVLYNAPPAEVAAASHNQPVVPVKPETH